MEAGNFTYTNDGFFWQHKKGRSYYAWNEIDAIFGFKADLMTYDEVCIDVFFKNDRCLSLPESSGGWKLFNKNLSDRIPGIPASWENEIALPAFEAKLTLLFEANGRTQFEAEVYYYGESSSS